VIRQNSYNKNRQLGKVFYYASARKKIGLQSMSNRLKDVSDEINFDWLNDFSFSQLRWSLKKSFLPYYCTTSDKRPIMLEVFPPGRASTVNRVFIAYVSWKARDCF